ncbi:UNVERIFIED_CONTAM: hypothetical protein GTU68_062598 [Idotea baltica]|nr:hypothetical protein [Idotea baltica]
MTETTVEQIKPGISKADVLLLLGTPLMQDDFQGKRWDYLYYTVENGQRSEQKSLTVIFDGNTVASVK